MYKWKTEAAEKVSHTATVERDPMPQTQTPSTPPVTTADSLSPLQRQCQQSRLPCSFAL